LVAGEVDLSQYDINKKVGPYVLYQYDKRTEIKQQTLNAYDGIIAKFKAENTNPTLLTLLESKREDISDMTDEEYFEVATSGLTYDKETGNAYSTFNPKGKYMQLLPPSHQTAMCLVNDSFQCYVRDLPQNTTNSEMKQKYSEYWDKIMSEGTEFDKYDLNTTYQNKERYLSFMTEQLYYNAFVSNKTGWLEQGDEDQIQWVLNFRERFINKLPLDTKLQVYNFSR
jgi:hypothetical protein